MFSFVERIQCLCVILHCNLTLHLSMDGKCRGMCWGVERSRTACGASSLPAQARLLMLLMAVVLLGCWSTLLIVIMSTCIKFVKII